MKTKTQKHAPEPLNFHTQCGCKLIRLPEGTTILHCKIHKAAPDLLAVAKALGDLEEFINGTPQQPRNWTGPQCDEARRLRLNAMSLARTAIAKAEEK